MNEKNKLPERANAPGHGFTAEEIAQALIRETYGGKEEGMSLVAADMLREQAKRIGELEAELAKLREESRWIPVEERLPDTDEGPTTRNGELVAVSVLAVIEGAEWGTELYFDGDEFFDMQGDELIPYRVSHWKPMPRRTEAGHD